MSPTDPNQLSALCAELAEVIRRQRAEIERITAAAKYTIGEYSRAEKDGRREWWSGGAWLYPGQRVVIVSAAPSGEGVEEQPPPKTDLRPRSKRYNSVAEMLADAPKPPSGWQPIETAPKDGTFIDLFAGGARYTDCHWMDTEGWMGCRPFYPTHWMPAPPAPKEGES